MKHIDYDLEASKRTWWFNNTGGSAHDGITVRDYFAAKAMEGLMARPDSTPGAFDFEKYKDDPQRVARWAYWLADAMMKARVLDKQGEQ